MASRCAAFGTGTRKKLSNWLVHENHQHGAADKFEPTVPADRHMLLRKVNNEFLEILGTTVILSNEAARTW